ncbi:MAG: hypothetical protein JWO37_3804 [Acidimicrobiales bacterium]|nr:hypothetical protein [Acidimicrobiales bacterium]
MGLVEDPSGPEASPSWGRRARNRAPIFGMLGFLAGVLCAALFIPSHAQSGLRTAAGDVSSSGAGSAGPGDAAAAGGSAPGASATGGSGTANGLTGGGSAGAGQGGVAGSQRASTLAPPGGNGGSTAPGVTATSINLGVLGGDSTGVTPACPRCGQGGQATDEALVAGLFNLWHRQGKLPVYGRELTPIFQEANDLDVTGASYTSACQNLVSRKSFVVAIGSGAEGAEPCLAKQFHVLTLDAYGGPAKADIESASPYLWEVGPSVDEVLSNFAIWADQHNLLKNQVLGLYAPADGSTYGNIQEIVNATFVPQLKKLGYHLAVNYAWSGTGQSDDAIAVQKMKSAGVTVVFIVTGLSEPAGFQNQAEQIGYRPKYPAPGYALGSFTDATADVSWNATAEDGNLLFAASWWGPWSARRPAAAAGNATVQECLDAYEAGSHTTLDVYNDDAKISYLLSECSNLDVILQAIINAGPKLTQAGFISGIEAIRNMRTPAFPSVSFGPQRHEGSDTWLSAQFNKNRWQPSNDYINRFGNPQPWWMVL